MWSWGRGSEGQLGHGDQLARSRYINTRTHHASLLVERIKQQKSRWQDIVLNKHTRVDILNVPLNEKHKLNKE